MEVEVTTKMEKIRNFVKDNAGIIIGSGLCIVGGVLLGYDIGHSKGICTGRDRILDEILYNTDKRNGLIMVNPDLGRYLFTAKKLTD